MADDALTPRPAAPLAPADPAAANPLRQLPREFVHPVTQFLLLNQSIVRDPTALCLRLRRWAREDGLTLAELLAVFGRLSDPAVTAGHKGEWDVLADVARFAGLAMDRRKTVERMLARRKAVAGEADAAAPAEAWRAAADEIGRMD